MARVRSSLFGSGKQIRPSVSVESLKFWEIHRRRQSDFGRRSTSSMLTSGAFWNVPTVTFNDHNGRIVAINKSFTNQSKLPQQQLTSLKTNNNTTRDASWWVLSTPNGCTRNQRKSYLSRKKPKIRQKSSREGPVEPRNISEHQKFWKQQPVKKVNLKRPARQARPRQRSKCQIKATQSVQRTASQRAMLTCWKVTRKLVTASPGKPTPWSFADWKEMQLPQHNGLEVYFCLWRVWKWELSSWKQQRFRESISSCCTARKCCKMKVSCRRVWRRSWIG